MYILNGFPYELYDNSKGIVSIDSTGDSIDKGKIHYVQMTITGVAQNNAANFYFKTGTTTPYVIDRQVSVSHGNVELVLYEGATASADGVAQNNFNLNLNDVVTAQMQAFINPTITDKGTAFDSDYIPPQGGTGNNLRGTFSNARLKRVIKPNTNYLMEFTNKESATLDIRLRIIFYEK